MNKKIWKPFRNVIENRLKACIMLSCFLRTARFPFCLEWQIFSRQRSCCVILQVYFHKEWCDAITSNGHNGIQRFPTSPNTCLGIKKKKMQHTFVPRDGQIEHCCFYFWLQRTAFILLECIDMQTKVLKSFNM